MSTAPSELLQEIKGDVACLIVSDRVSEAEMATFKDYFRRMRAATEPRY